MKELSSHPRSRLIGLTPHNDPLARFSDHEDSGPVEVSAEAGLGSDYQTRPHEIAGYISVSGNQSLQEQDSANDWSIGDTATAQDVDESPLYLAHRYEPRPPRTVQMVATATVCGLLAYSLYLDRPDLAEIRSWFTRNNVIELPAIAAPPASAGLADEPGRVATPTPEPVRVPEVEPAETAAATSTQTVDAAASSSRLELLVGDSTVSIGRARRNDPVAKEARSKEITPKEVKPQATSRAAQPSPSSLTQALNAAALAPEARSANSTAAATAPGRGDDAQVKRVLTGFQVAYNALDVEGTKRVWPAVDAKALARVFQSLESQQLELTGCQVATAGDRAQASCSGRARMVPKDKSKGPRVESRQWTFDLHRSFDRWDVVALNMK